MSTGTVLPSIITNTHLSSPDLNPHTPQPNASIQHEPPPFFFRLTFVPIQPSPTLLFLFPLSFISLQKAPSSSNTEPVPPHTSPIRLHQGPALLGRIRAPGEQHAFVALSFLVVAYAAWL